MKPSVYIETPIVSYLTGRLSRELIIAGRQALTAEWWETRRERFDVYVSPLVVSEAQEGDTYSGGTQDGSSGWYSRACGHG
jgi:hypothetical protein